MMHVGRVPLIAQVELTNHCPYTCIGCPRTHDMSRPLGFMTRETFEAVIEAVKPVQRSWGPLALHHMGESTLHPEIAQFVAHATSQGVPTVLACRPNHLPPAKARALLEAGLTVLVISIDALDTTTLRSISGKVANYERAAENVDAMLAIRRELGASTQVMLQMISYAANEHQWQQFLSQWYREDEGVTTALKRFSSWTLPKLADHAGKNITPLGTICQIPFKTCVVLWDGRVALCNRDHDARQVFGNVSEGIEAVWNGPAYQRFRQQFEDDELPADAMCRGCSRYPWQEQVKRGRESGQAWFGGEAIAWEYSEQWWLEHFGARMSG